MHYRLLWLWTTLVLAATTLPDCAHSDPAGAPGRRAAVAEGDLIDVKLASGKIETGLLVSDGATALILAQRYGTLLIPRMNITAVRHARPRAEPAKPPPAPGGRLVSLARALEVAAGRPWAKDLRQVPATVIDQGVLRAVPYISHRAGTLELNVYGDPDAPAGIEVGNYGESDAVKEEIRKVVSGLLPEAADRELLAGMTLVRQSQERQGLTIEISTPDAPDAYGGWWISIFDLAAIEAARASDRELTSITAPAPAGAPPATDPAKPPPAGVAAPSPAATAPAPASASPVEAALQCAEGDVSACSGWSESDAAALARRRAAGRVYVRGFHRQDGKYVRPQSPPPPK